MVFCGTNKKSGDCSYCGRRVEAKKGFLFKLLSGVWRVYHKPCAFKSADARPVMTGRP